MLACSGSQGGAPVATTTTTMGDAPLLLAVDAPVSVPPTMAVPPGSELADTRDVQLRSAAGRPPGGPAAAPVAMSGGSARLSGIVQGPDGPQAGATVRVERFVEDRVGRVDTTSAGDGSFGLAGLPGGRYRLRAWFRPSLTATRSVVTFLVADGGALISDLVLERHSATTMLGTVGVARWQVGQRAGVSVLVSQEYVDGDGIVRTGGVAGAPINLQVPSGLVLISDDSAVTGTDGYARFGVECAVSGRYTLVAESSGYTRPIAAPVCNPPPPPPTVSPTTAAVNIAPFDVGRSLDTPAAGPYPAGTYTAANADAATRCLTVFEVQTAGDWRRDAAGPVIQAAGPIRSLQPGPGSSPCTYRRTS
jgi:hypothetical protein